MNEKGMLNEKDFKYLKHRLWELGFKSYKEYLLSYIWRNKVIFILEEENCCEECGKTYNLQIHHKHYKTLGFEKREDLQVLCNTCHKKKHGL